MSYKYILFDLDGTLTDPKVGITKSVQHALKKFSIDVSNLDNLEKFIGPPLKDSFMQFYNFNEKQAYQAIDYYREYFKDTGIFENKLYPGIAKLLKQLNDENKIVAVSTSKPTVFAERVLNLFKLNTYFRIIVGSNLDGSRSSKTKIINHTLKQLDVQNLKDVVMIGDRKYDMLGAINNKIDCIAVSYGYGSLPEITQCSPTYLVDSVEQLSALLTKQELKWI